MTVKQLRDMLLNYPSDLDVKVVLENETVGIQQIFHSCTFSKNYPSVQDTEQVMILLEDRHGKQANKNRKRNARH